MSQGGVKDESVDRGFLRDWSLYIGAGPLVWLVQIRAGPYTYTGWNERVPQF